MFMANKGRFRLQPLNTSIIPFYRWTHFVPWAGEAWYNLRILFPAWLLWQTHNSGRYMHTFAVQHKMHQVCWNDQVRYPATLLSARGQSPQDHAIQVFHWQSSEGMSSSQHWCSLRRKMWACSSEKVWYQMTVEPLLSARRPRSLWYKRLCSRRGFYEWSLLNSADTQPSSRSSFLWTKKKNRCIWFSSI